MKRACVIGAGAWGTALALVLARSGSEVLLVARNRNRAEEIQTQRENKRYLPGIALPESIRVVASYDEALKEAGLVVVAVPLAALSTTIDALQKTQGIVVVATKGIDAESLARADEIVAEAVPRSRLAILSGPSFALEVAMRKPTAITMAAQSHELARKAAAWFSDAAFRVYTNDDPIGVAIGGALKNVVAIAAGIADGMRLGHNAVAAVVTRGLAEIARIAVRCGGKKETLMGLAGLGDLVLTCTGPLSRNRRLGQALAHGASLEAARAAIGQVVEGVETALAAQRLCEKLRVEAPLMNAVASIVLGHSRPEEALAHLLARPEKEESI